jgi:hypothetical protein
MTFWNKCSNFYLLCIMFIESIALCPLMYIIESLFTLRLSKSSLNRDKASALADP